MSAPPARPTKTPRAPVDHDARLIGLVGGQHKSVIEKDDTMIYCVFAKDYRLIVHQCEECPLRTDRHGPA